MLEAGKYSAVETLRDGRSIHVRALHPEDRAGLLAALDRTSAQSMYRRFFAAKQSFSEREVVFFSNVDFAYHVALVATLEEGAETAIVGGGRYIVSQPGQAEVAFVVIDAYQGLGIGAMLMRNLVSIAREAELRELTAEVLADNAPMLRVFEKCGLGISRKREGGIVHVTLKLSP